MSNSRRWREFITWWNSVKKDIADEGTIKMIDERIRIIELYAEMRRDARERNC